MSQLGDIVRRKRAVSFGLDKSRPRLELDVIVVAQRCQLIVDVGDGVVVRLTAHQTIAFRVRVGKVFEGLFVGKQCIQRDCTFQEFLYLVSLHAA